MRKKHVAILGSTGTIGINTLKVIREMPERFKVVALSAFNNVKLLKKQIALFKPAYAAIDARHYSELKKDPVSQRVNISDASSSSLSALASLKNVDIVVIGITGAGALDPFMAAAVAGKRIAPANKEALVMAGELLMAAAAHHGASVIPVDSEQSAIFQCLQGKERGCVRYLHLTASGGALRNVPVRKHDGYSIQQILAHPRWRMGDKITIDSATLMNKGFEVIEAMRLFNIPADKIKVLVHPEAVIHSMVEFIDGSWLAQLGVTDMRLPIQYALTYPERLPNKVVRLDLAALRALHFELPDTRSFPSLDLAFFAAQRGKAWPAVLNAANEVAVAAFLEKRIKFTDIYRVVEHTVMAHRSFAVPGLDEIRQADTWARLQTSQFIKDKI